MEDTGDARPDQREGEDAEEDLRPATTAAEDGVGSPVIDVVRVELAGERLAPRELRAGELAREGSAVAGDRSQLC